MKWKRFELARLAINSIHHRDNVVPCRLSGIISYRFSINQAMIYCIFAGSYQNYGVIRVKSPVKQWLCTQRHLANRAMIDSPKNRMGRVLHAAWAVLAVVVSLLMIFALNKGHPPLIVFLPLVVLVWAIGHLGIWCVMRLIARGKRVAIETGSEGRSWTVGLRLAVIGTGILTSAGVFQIIVTGYLGRLYPYHYVNLWTIMLIIKLVHATCFVGLLLRQKWSRLTSALLAFGWAMLMALQIAEHLPLSAPTGLTELMIAFGIMVFLFILGVHLIVSRKVKSFLKN